MKIELAEAEPPPPVEILPPDKVAIVLPAPEPPPPVDLKPPPPPKPRPVEKPKPIVKRPPAAAAAPQATPDQAPKAAAPAQGATPEPPSAALPKWKGLLLRHLERHKRYPSEAQRQRQEGVVYVRFTLSRDGRVLASRLERASGVPSLDQEGLDLLQRAQPMPRFPPDQPGESMELVVPIQFFLRR
jgi:protein TonB